MGKKSAPSPPPPPDPLEIAQTDARFNRIDQHTPLGSLTYSGEDRNVATQTLNPHLQGLLNQQIGLDSNMLKESLRRLTQMDPNQIDLDQFGPIQSQLDLSGLDQMQDVDFGGLPGIPQDIEQYRGDVEDAFFNRGRRLLDPQIARQNEAQQQRLANQGLPQASDAYLGERRIFEDSRNRAYSDLADQSVLRGGQEASRQLANVLAARGQGVGERLQQAGFNNNNIMQNLGWLQQNLVNQNAGRTQGLNEAIGVRGNAFNEMAALMGLQQVQQPGLNNFFAPSQVDTGLGYQLKQNQLQNNYQGALDQQQGMMGGLFGLGSSLITAGGAGPGGLAGLIGSFSDRRLKRNIQQIDVVQGYPWYSFEYVWGEKSEGVMSDEIPSEFVTNVAGFDFVNYGELLDKSWLH